MTSSTAAPVTVFRRRGEAARHRAAAVFDVEFRAAPAAAEIEASSVVPAAAFVPLGSASGSAAGPAGRGGFGGGGATGELAAPEVPGGPGGPAPAVAAPGPARPAAATGAPSISAPGR